MSNVLAEDTRQQVLALGRLGWSLRRIEGATGVRRETASGYLKAAGLVVRGRGRPSARPANPAISPEVQEHDLQAPHRVGQAHGPTAHDGTITTEPPDVMWGDCSARSAVRTVPSVTGGT